MLWRLLLILICVNTVLLAQNQLELKKHYSIVTQFDLIADEDVNDNDPRVKSIIYSATSYPHSQIIINYVNPNALSLATKLAGIFSWHKLLVTRPAQTQLNGVNANKFVQVSIYYRE